MIRVAIFLLGIFLFFSTSAAAQGPAGVGAGPEHSSANQNVDDPWQIAIGYQYSRDNLVGSPFNISGVNVSLARYFRTWLGLEAQVGGGLFGNTGQTSTPPNLNAKSLFVGAGPHLVYRNRSRFEPWVHGLVGLDHYRFTQNVGMLGSNNALAGVLGGGVDMYLTPNIALRGESDFVVSRFFSATQRSFQVIGGFVLDF